MNADFKQLLEELAMMFQQLVVSKGKKCQLCQDEYILYFFVSRLSFLFPWVQCYTKHDALSIPENYQLYISGTTVLYNKCMLFSQWMPVLPREQKQVPRGGVVVYNPKPELPNGA